MEGLKAKCTEGTSEAIRTEESTKSGLAARRKGFDQLYYTSGTYITTYRIPIKGKEPGAAFPIAPTVPASIPSRGPRISRGLVAFEPAAGGVKLAIPPKAVAVPYISTLS